MVAHSRNNRGDRIVSWIDRGGGVRTQVGAEGMIAAFLFAAAGASFIAAVIVLRKSENEELSDRDRMFRGFAFTCPLWCFLSYQIFSEKMGRFRVKFRP
jgi:bacteriorhodopsin